MKILFVIKRIDYGDHIAISYLSSIAKELGHSTFLCIMDNKDIYKTVEDIKPNIIAYSANAVGYDQMVEANSRLKEKYSFISIMGGPQPTFNQDLFLSSSMDVFCIGEGDIAFRDFLIKIENSESFDDIPNLITKNRINPVRNLIEDLGELPIPDRSLTLENSFLKGTSKKTFYTSRGCPFSCSYCCNNIYNNMYRGKGKIVRRFPVDYVIKEMKQVLNKYTMDFVKIGDDIFAYKADKWLEEFTEKYSKEIGLPFNCYLRLDMVDDKLLSLLKRAGCHSVLLSVDSCSNYIREKILNRKWKDINIEENIKLIHKYKIKTWVNFMLAAPESTIKNELESIYLGHKTNVTYTAYSITTPMRGTDIFTYSVDNGYLDINFDGYKNSSFDYSPLSCFSKKHKNIINNIYCLGPIVAKLPFPLFQIGIFIIKHVNTKKFFYKIRKWYLNYNRENILFKIDKKKERKNASRKN